MAPNMGQTKESDITISSIGGQFGVRQHQMTDKYRRLLPF